MDKNMLYHKASHELMSAKQCQSQISQKQFELQLLDINSRYKTDNISAFSSIAQKQSIYSTIANLKNIRNNYIYNAIEASLDLCNIELSENNSFSMASIALNAIISFIQGKISAELNIPFTLRVKISQIYFNSISINSQNISLKIEIQRLKDECRC